MQKRFCENIAKSTEKSDKVEGKFVTSILAKIVN